MGWYGILYHGMVWYITVAYHPNPTPNGTGRYAVQVALDNALAILGLDYYLARKHFRTQIVYSRIVHYKSRRVLLKFVASARRSSDTRSL